MGGGCLSHHNSEKGVLVLLIEALRGHVDAGEPAAIAWMAVVPANDILEAADLPKQPEEPRGGGRRNGVKRVTAFGCAGGGVSSQTFLISSWYPIM